MANYNKSVNFAVKDTLQSGDPNKIVSGVEIDTEFNNISSASTTKIDKVPTAQTNNIAVFSSTGSIQDSGATVDQIIPSGIITMWSGFITAIPSGWTLCDGTNSTPDLRNRFVVGAGDEYSENDTGGEDSVTLTENEIPSHNHGIPARSIANASGSGDANRLARANDSSGTAYTFSNMNDAGGDQAHENRPPYFALAYIMKE